MNKIQLSEKNNCWKCHYLDRLVFQDDIFRRKNNSGILEDLIVSSDNHYVCNEYFQNNNIDENYKDTIMRLLIETPEKFVCDCFLETEKERIPDFEDRIFYNEGYVYIQDFYYGNVRFGVDYPLDYEGYNGISIEEEERAIMFKNELINKYKDTIPENIIDSFFHEIQDYDLVYDSDGECIDDYSYTLYIEFYGCKFNKYLKDLKIK
jgi:hypothetical protein